METAITGDDEVEKKGTLEFRSTLTIRENERVPVESFTLSIRPEGEANEEVYVTFAPDGTVLDITSTEEVAGEGEIRTQQLREALDITLAERDAGYGYGDSYGYDERGGGERVDFGYGYGYEAGDGSGATFTYDIELGAKPFKHGDYELFLSVNTPTERGLFESNHKPFEVLNPSGADPSDGDGTAKGSDRGRSHDHWWDRGPSDDRRHQNGGWWQGFGFGNGWIWNVLDALSAHAVGR